MCWFVDISCTGTTCWTASKPFFGSGESGRSDAPDDEIVCFAEDRWQMYGRRGELGIHFQGHDKVLINFLRRNPLQEGSLVDDHVNCIYIDRSGIVWVGTNQGVSFYNPLFEPFEQTFLPSSTNNIDIYDFYKDEQTNSLWIATSDGLFIKKGDGKEIFERRMLILSWRFLLFLIWPSADVVDWGTDYTLCKMTGENVFTAA